MDPTLANAVVVVSLILLAVSLLLLASAVMPLIGQAQRTLIAVEKLADTLQAETKPTLIELQEVLSGVNQLRSATANRVTEVGHKVEDVAGSFGQIADTAKKKSSVWGTGLLAGIKAYLTGSGGEQQRTKQLTADKGDNDEQ